MKISQGSGFKPLNFYSSQMDKQVNYSKLSDVLTNSMLGNYNLTQGKKLCTWHMYM